VIVTPGSTTALYLSLIGTLTRGDEVVFIEPYYMGYTSFVKYLDLKVIPVHLQEERRFHPDMEELREKVTSKTKIILLCSPNNPTGTVFNEKELNEIAEVAEEKDILIISDEIYDQFTWDGTKHHSIAALPSVRDRTIVIMSFSKTFAMTGWRMGSIMADEEIVRPLRRVPIGGRPATFIQRAGLSALNGPWEPVEKFRIEYKKRIDYLVKRLNEIEGISCESPEGAFYLFPNFEAIGLKSIEFCEGLLDEEKLAAVPGIAFGATGEYHMRIPLVRPVEFLEKCAAALERYVDKVS
jgi:aspartate/methionine/tyrosine aminotransferase